MLYYQHYSFDLWLTLIKSNPLFKQQRAIYFFEQFNHRQKTLDEVKLIFRQVDVMCNTINEKTGKNIDAEEMYLMVITMMNEYDMVAYHIDINELYHQMECLLFKHLPVVYSAETTDVLRVLKHKSNSSFNILSNTGFIKGQTLRKVLKTLELDDLFDFQLYSDEAGFSKPSKHFFELMLNHVAHIKNNRLPDLKTIIHVGDNLNADIAGAEAMGISSLLINSNYNLISSLLPT